MVQHINEVFCNLTSDPWETGSRGCRHRFLVMIWHANCSFQDASRNLHNKWTYSGFWIFFVHIYSGTFQKVIAFCDRFLALVDRVKKSLLGTISLSKMHFIDVFHIFVNALCQNIQKYGWMQCTWSIGKDEGNIWQVGERSH